MKHPQANHSNLPGRAILLGISFAVSSAAAFAQPMSGKAAERAAFDMANQFVVSCSSKYYTQTTSGSVREYREKLRLELFIPAASQRATVSEADVLNGIRWRGLAEFGLGKVGRSITEDGKASEWSTSFTALRFNFSYRDGGWQIDDDRVTSDLFGDYKTLVRGLTCEQIQQRALQTK